MKKSADWLRTYQSIKRYPNPTHMPKHKAHSLHICLPALEKSASDSIYFSRYSNLKKS